MRLAEIRALATNDLLRTYDLEGVEDEAGVRRAIDADLDEGACVVVLDLDEPRGDLTATPDPLPEPEPTPEPAP